MEKTDKLSLEEMLKLAKKVKTWKSMEDSYGIKGIEGNIDSMHIYIFSPSLLFNSLFRGQISIQNTDYSDVIGSYRGFSRRLRKFLYDTIPEIKNEEILIKNKRIKKGIDYVRDLIK